MCLNKEIHIFWKVLMIIFDALIIGILASLFLSISLYYYLIFILLGLLLVFMLVNKDDFEFFSSFVLTNFIGVSLSILISIFVGSANTLIEKEVQNGCRIFCAESVYYKSTHHSKGGTSYTTRFKCIDPLTNKETEFETNQESVVTFEGKKIIIAEPSNIRGQFIFVSRDKKYCNDPKFQQGIFCRYTGKNLDKIANDESVKTQFLTISERLQNNPFCNYPYLLSFLFIAIIVVCNIKGFGIGCISFLIGIIVMTVGNYYVRSEHYMFSIFWFTLAFFVSFIIRSLREGL